MPQIEQVQFQSWHCNVKYAKYGNGRLAIVLADSTTNQAIAKASINIPDEKLANNEVAIKDFAENRGMLAALTAAGIVSEPLWFVDSGYVYVPICKYIGIKSKIRR